MATNVDPATWRWRRSYNGCDRRRGFDKDGSGRRDELIVFYKYKKFF